jgi:hypothetical protein
LKYVFCDKKQNSLSLFLKTEMLVGVITMKYGKRWEQFQNTFKEVKYHIIEAMTAMTLK